MDHIDAQNGENRLNFENFENQENDQNLDSERVYDIETSVESDSVNENGLRERIQFLDNSDSEKSPENEKNDQYSDDQFLGRRRNMIPRKSTEKDIHELLITRVKELEELNEILNDENGILRRKIASLEK